MSDEGTAAGGVAGKEGHGAPGPRAAGRPWRVPLAGLAVAAALLAAPATARADRFYFQSTFHARLGWLRVMPLAWSAEEDTSHQDTVRTLPAGTLAAAGAGAALLGAGLDLGFAYRDRWVFPLIGFELDAVVGAQRPQITSHAGTLVELQPWTFGMGTLLLPGFGVRIKARRWVAQLTARTGIGLAFLQAQASLGPDRVDLTLTAFTFVVRAEAEICRRLDPTQRLCLFAGLRLYEFGPVNGGVAGLRWEFGP